MVAIDISTMRDPDEFRAAMGEYVDRIKSVPTRDDVDEVLLPGELEARTRQENERRGVPLSRATVESLERLGETYELPVPEST